MKIYVFCEEKALKAAQQHNVLVWMLNFYVANKIWLHSKTYFNIFFIATFIDVYSIQLAKALTIHYVTVPL